MTRSSLFKRFARRYQQRKPLRNNCSMELLQKEDNKNQASNSAWCRLHTSWLSWTCLVVMVLWNMVLGWTKTISIQHDSHFLKPMTVTNYSLYELHGYIVKDGTTPLNMEVIRKLPPRQTERAMNNRVDNAKVDDPCMPIQAVHDQSFPSCNILHELDLTDMVHTQQLKHLGAGAIRDTWKISTGKDQVVLKTLKPNRNPTDAREMSFANFEAVSMAQLTRSDYVMNVHGYCGQSTLNQLGGKDVPSFLKSARRVDNIQKLAWARDAAQAVAHVHTTTFVHSDLRPNNFLVCGNQLQLNDFNRGRYLRWNMTDGSPCGVPWFSCHRLSSPEECNDEGLITEKIDVYQLGNFFYYILTELKTPFGWFPDVAFKPAVKLLGAKMSPSQHLLYQKLQFSRDPAVAAIFHAMMLCHTFDPHKRPSAQEIVTMLNHSFPTIGACRKPGFSMRGA